MRARLLIVTLAAGLAATSRAQDRDVAREIPLLNVELVDSSGLKMELKGFHMLSGEHRYQGYLGSGEIEVSYRRLREIRVAPPKRPGGRMTADLVLRSGNTVRTEFDEREGELLFAGFAPFGRVTFYFRDVRRLKILGFTKRSELPRFGRGTGGVDVRLKDRTGTVTELSGFRRAAGECTLTGVRGSTSITIPIRILKRVTFAHDPRSPMLRGTGVLKDDRKVDFHLPIYEERNLYRGEGEFGDLRIRIVDVRDLIIHRSTPLLRDLDPVQAAQGRAKDESESRR